MSGEKSGRREEVELTNLDQPLFDGAGRDQGRPGRLPRRGRRPDARRAARPAAVGDPGAARPGARSCRRTSRSTRPTWVRTVTIWAEARSARSHYALCNDRRDAAVVRQPARRRVPPDARARRSTRPPQTHLVLDLDPPTGSAVRRRSCAPRGSCAQALADVGLAGAVKTSGAKGVHVFVPVAQPATTEAIAAATRALAARAERSTRRWRRRPTSSRIARARSSSTPPARAAPPSSPPTARASGRARRSRSRCAWDELDRRRAGRLHDPHRAGADRRRATRGPSRCPSRSRCRPTLSRRAARSRSPASPRCTRASAAPARGDERPTASDAVDLTGALDWRQQPRLGTSA